MTAFLLVALLAQAPADVPVVAISEPLIAHIQHGDITPTFPRLHLGGDTDTGFARLQLGTSTPKHQGLVRLSVSAHATAQFADATTTAYAMGRGGFREANPIARPFAGDPIKLAIFKGVYASGTSYLFLKLGKKKPMTAIVGAALHTVLTSWVVARNSHTLRPEK